MSASQWPKVVLVANPGADVYGSDLQMLESVSAMRDAGVEVHVTCPSAGPLVPLLLERGAQVRVDSFPVVRRSYLSARGLVALCLDLLRSARPMREVVRSTRPDLIYVNTTTVPWWIAVSRLMGVPVVCHVHEAEDRDNIWVLRALNAPLLFADRLILISRTAANATWRVFSGLQRRSLVVVNGVPDRPTPPVPPPGGPTVSLAVVGRLSPRKAPHVAIESTAILLERGHDVRLEVAGSPFPGYEWYEQSLRDLAVQRGIAARVAFTGYVSPSSKAFDRADIVFAPSVREPFGNTVVEAQLAERPVVAAAAGGHLESIVDGVTGMHVPAEDAAAAAAAVEALIADRGLSARIGREARVAALERFGIPRYRLELMEALAAAHKPRSLWSPKRPAGPGREAGPTADRPLRPRSLR